MVVESPYRALAGPLLAYLEVLDAAWPPDKDAPITFVILPEYVARHWWERILYNQASKRLKTILLGRPHTVVVNVPYRREDPALFEAALGGTRGGEAGANERLVSAGPVRRAARPGRSRPARFASGASVHHRFRPRRPTRHGPGGIVSGHA